MGCVCVSCSVVSDSLPLHRLGPASLPHPWEFPGKNTGVGCHSLLQGIFPNPGIKPWSPALQADSLLSEPLGKTSHVGGQVILGRYTTTTKQWPLCRDFPGGPVVGILLPMLGMRFKPSSGNQDPTCRRATKPAQHNYWACMLQSLWFPEGHVKQPRLITAHTSPPPAPKTSVNHPWWLLGGREGKNYLPHAQEGEAEMLSSHSGWILIWTINLHKERFAIFGDDYVFCGKNK